VTEREHPADRADAGAAGVSAGGGNQGATFEGETTGPGGDTSPAVTAGDIDEQAHEIVDDVFLPDGERQDDGDVQPEPEAQNLAVVDSENVSPEVAAAAAAEVEAAELSDAATAGTHSPGGESAPDPE
jgi:hypothetical protein